MTDRCQPIRDAIANLQEDIAALQEEFRNASTAAKGLLTARIQQDQDQIKQLEMDLANCQNTLDDPISGLRLFGFEINQGLRGYNLVAGKDTLIRVFVGSPPQIRPPIDPTLRINTNDEQQGHANVTHTTTGHVFNSHGEPTHKTAGSSFHEDVSSIIPSARIDSAVLVIQSPQGASYEVIGQMSSNLFTNTSQSFLETDNINFYLPGSLLTTAGQYDFTASFYRSGRQIGRVNIGSATFSGTRDLRILIAQDVWPLPVYAWNALYQALLRLSRDFPIRSGIGPMDSNLAVGLRYAFDPIPFDPNFPNWSAARQKLQSFNSRQATQGKPDRADRIMTVRVQQPGEACRGGVAEMGGVVIAVVLNTLNTCMTPPTNPDLYFASILCQEVAHTFNIDHSANSAITDASAFDLLNRRSIPNPKPFMGFGYTNNGLNDESLFEPQDWNSVLNQLRI